jgi:hypothetical protein
MPAKKEAAIKRWKHIEDIGGDLWVLRIWRSIHAAVDDGRMMECPKKFSELALHVSTRLTMLRFIVERINKECIDLWTICDARDKEGDYWSGHEGYSLRVDDKLKYNLAIDLDSLLFEFNSCLELMRQFVFAVYKHTNKIVNKNEKEKLFKGIILSGVAHKEWYDKLEKHRNDFIHLAAPYVIIDLTHEGKYYDLIITKEHLRKFDDNNKFVLLSELNIIVNGFQKARSALQKHLVDYIDNLPQKYETTSEKGR